MLEGVEDEDEWVFPAKGMALGKHQPVYAAELVGVQLALSTVTAILASRPNPDSVPTPIHLFLDNQSAVLNSCSPAPTSGQHLRRKNLTLYHSLLSTFPRASLTVHWVPGHVGVDGNEAADAAAKTASGRTVKGEEGGEEGEDGDGIDGISGGELPKSRSALLAEFHLALPARWNALWRAPGVRGAPLRRVDHHQPSRHILRLHKSLPRPLSSLLTQLRNGHSHLLADRYRSRTSPTDRCECGNAPETLSHFLLSCPLYRAQGSDLAKSVGTHFRDISFLLTSHTAIPHTLAIVLATERFTRYHFRLSVKSKEEEKTKSGRVVRRNQVLGGRASSRRGSSRSGRGGCRGVQGGRVGSTGRR
ncbi:hypothetical protein JCM11641_006013 [Rhodosporidiobolus odoratus]